MMNAVRLGLIGVLTLVLGACGFNGGGAAATGTPGGLVTGKFSHPTRIDNAWYPLVPGTQFTFEGHSNRGLGQLPHRLVSTVTDLTKVINGVRTVVIWERDINRGELSEAELAFHAQDDDGNVWLFGEYPELYKGGKFTGAPSTWLAGIGDGIAGLDMRAKPQVATSDYSQGLARSVGFRDRAKVHATGQKTCVPVGCYDAVLVTEEWDAGQPDDGHQLKYYAQGVGSVRVGAEGGVEEETLVLAQVVRLGPDELAQARAEALKLDAHASVVNTNYARTPPADRPSGVA